MDHYSDLDNYSGPIVDCAEVRRKAEEIGIHMKKSTELFAPAPCSTPWLSSGHLPYVIDVYETVKDGGLENYV